MMNMRTRYFFALMAATAFAATGCAADTGPAVEIMMDPDAPVTEGPGAEHIWERVSADPKNPPQSQPDDS